MKRYGLIFLILGFFFITPDFVFAHPGRTDGKGCHTCRKNCSSWGLSQDEYHCHNGNTYTNSKGQVYQSDGTFLREGSNSNQGTIEGKPKSSDNTLKSVVVDGNSLSISSRMYYDTKNETVLVTAEASDNKATVTIIQDKLYVGKNDIFIRVKAEDGSEKEYTLVVTREKLSSNTNITVTVDSEEIHFSDGKASIEVSSDMEQLQYECNLEDKRASVKVEGDLQLQYGNNVVRFLVTAEDGTEQVYELTVDRYTESYEAFLTIFGFFIFCVIGGGVFFFIKGR